MISSGKEFSGRGLEFFVTKQDFIADRADIAHACCAENLPKQVIFVGYLGRLTLPNRPSLLHRLINLYKLHFTR
jgi:hypothetical protein